MTKLEKLRGDCQKAADALDAACDARDAASEAYLNEYSKTIIMKQRAKQ